MVVIADLVARVRSEGVQQVAQDLRGVGQEAKLAGDALRIMAEQFAKTQGGTAAGWMDIFKSTNVQPTAAAMAEAARQAEKTTAAVQASVAPTKAAATAAAEHAKGWTASESSIVRFGAALLGVNLGFSLIAGGARQIHEAILGSIDAARQLEVAGRAAAAGYGQSAAGTIAAGASAFVADPNTRGTAAQYTEAVAGLRSLTTSYGLNLSQVQDLVKASGELARVQGVDLPTAAKALDAVMRGNTSAAEGLGITLTDETGRLRGVGASYDELVAISGRTRAEQVLLATTLQNVKAQQDNAKGSSDNLAAAYDRLGKNAEIARQKMGQQLSGPAAFVVGGAADLLVPPGPTAAEALQRRAGMVGSLSGGRGQLDTGEILAATETQQRLQSLRTQDAQLAARMMSEERADLIQATSATQQNTAAVQAQLTAYENLRVGIDRTVQSIGRIRQEQGQFATIGEAARGPYFPQVLGSAQTIGAAAAASDELALRAQRVAQGSGDRMRGQLEQSITTAGQIGPNAVARAQQDLAQYDQRVAARTQQAQAQHDLAISDLNLAQTQAGLTDITLRQRDRELEMQRETIGLRREDVQLQRTALQASQVVTGARLAALPAQNAASAASYQSSLAGALAQQRMGRLIQGKDVSGLPSIDDLIHMNVNAQFAQAEAAPGALMAGRAVELAQQKQTAAQLAEQQKSTQLQSAQLDVEQANLGDLPQQTSLLSEMNQQQRAQLLIQQEERDAMLKLIDIASHGPVAGAGFSAPTTVNVTISGPVSMRSDQDVDALASIVAAKVFGGDEGGPPAAPEMPGARRGPF